MCGRYSLIASLDELAPRFEFDPADFADAPVAPGAPRYNVAPTQPALVVTGRPVAAGTTGTSGMTGMPGTQQRQRRAEYMRWGLIPSWAKDAGAGRPLINARSETLAEKPSFREALQRRRCLIPADGFYEWQPAGQGAGNGASNGAGPTRGAPMRVVLDSREPFAFAGLWETWRAPDGASVHSCAIITTAANDLLRPIHERMPVILPRELEGFWLDEAVTDPAALSDLLAPYPAEDMAVYEVSSLVNKAANDGPELIAPAGPAQGQGRLI